MEESVLINEILEMFDKKGARATYEKLLEDYKRLSNPSPNIYLFLASLAALNNLNEEALEWLRISIEDKGNWYRPGMLDDKDLRVIRDEKKFIELVKLSDSRYESAFRRGSLKCTWSRKTLDNIALVLHGNKQDNNISKECWESVKLDNFQIEYLQSPDIDSEELCWWKYDTDYSGVILKLLSGISWNSYKSRMLCGFSSGCDVILKLINERKKVCERAILIAPWVKHLDNEMDMIVKSLVDSNTHIFIICGEKDSNIKSVKRLERLIQEYGGFVKALYLEGVYHTYPNNLSVLINDLVLGE